ncbi:endonuclease domain-containing protein [Nevskia soli]|uniref:endonuclease domain-containing protein n=1 Tax=Nevskia soli TaxID=418856 RepID=UPI0009FC092B|nr:DUF559 domain-containing protein [Nevskia soli]
MRNHRTPLTSLARNLRSNSTDAERLIWRSLRNRTLFSCKFRRQYPIGPYIADFACVEKRLIVELDGGQHADNVIQDEARTAFLQTQGYRVLRFWNNDVLSQTAAVLEAIHGAVNGE